MRETHTLLVAVVLAVLAIWFRLAPEERMKGAQALSPLLAGLAIGTLIVSFMR